MASVPEPRDAGWEPVARQEAAKLELMALGRMEALRSHLSYILAGQVRPSPDVLLGLAGLLKAAGEFHLASRYRAETT